MLVLSRKSGEELVIPKYGIVMKILEIRGKQVRVGISAHTNVKVHRREIWERMHRRPASKSH